MRKKRNRLRDVPAQELKIHPKAQRLLNPTKLRGIVASCDLDAIGTVHVVEKDDELYVIDGQHRVTALIRLGLGEWPVRCEIHDVAGDAEASALFLKLNTRAVVNPYDHFRNEVYAGDPVAAGAEEIVTKLGLRVSRQSGDGNVAAVASIKRVYAIDDGKTLSDVLESLTTSYGQTADAVEGKLIDGLATVYSRLNGEIDRDVLKKKLAKYPGGAPAIIGDARGLSRIRNQSVARSVAEVVVETYNRGRRTKVELPR